MLCATQIQRPRLSPCHTAAPPPPQVIQDPGRGIVVAEAREVAVANERDCVELMREGIANRAVSATAMNAGKAAAWLVAPAVPVGSSMCCTSEASC
jgi:hypothetical protein